MLLCRCSSLTPRRALIWRALCGRYVVRRRAHRAVFTVVKYEWWASQRLLWKRDGGARPEARRSQVTHGRRTGLRDRLGPIVIPPLTCSVQIINVSIAAKKLRLNCIVLFAYRAFRRSGIERVEGYLFGDLLRRNLCANTAIAIRAQARQCLSSKRLFLFFVGFMSGLREAIVNVAPPRDLSSRLSICPRLVVAIIDQISPANFCQ